MSNTSPSSGCNTSRASRRSSNTKDPPWSRRVLDTAHAVQAVLQANNEILQASIERRQFENEFAEFYSNWPRDEEYYALLAECRQTRLALRQANPGSTYTFLDILTTTLIRYTTRANIEELACEDEHKFKSCSSPSLSFRTHAHSSDSTRLEAVQTSHKGSRSAPLLMNDEKVHEDKHGQICSSPLLSPHVTSRSSDSRRPEAIHLGHQVPDQLVEVPRDTSPSTASLHPDVKSLRRVTIASPPIHGEVASSTRKQLLSRKAISEDDETEADTCLLIPLTAFTLPKQTPVRSIRAISPRQGGKEFRTHPSTLATPGRHGSTNVVSQGKAATVH